MISKIDIKDTESVSKSITYLMLSCMVAFVGTVATVMALGLAASEFHTHPWTSAAIVAYAGFIVWGTNLLGIRLYNKSESSL